MTALPWKRARSLGIILILTLIFFNQLAFSGKILARGDTYNYFYPYWDARNLAFREARLPLWTPDLFMGAPLLANPQMGTYYPPNWPTTPFRAPTAIAISILLHTALAAAGTCFLYLEAVSRRWIPALAAGVIFAFGGYLGAHVEQINQLQGLAWMPILFALYHRILTRGHPRRDALLLAMAWALQIFSGHTQTVFISGVGMAIYGMSFAITAGTHDGRRARMFRALLLLAACFTTALLLALPQLLPSLELLRLSNRSGGFDLQNATAFSLPPNVLGRALLPSYDGQLFGEYVSYIGIISLGLAIWAMVSGPLADRRKWIWMLLAALGLALALGRYNPIYLLLAELPGFNLFRAPARFLALFSLAMAVLAGRGIESLGLPEEPESGRFRRIAQVAAVIALLVILTVFILQPDPQLIFGDAAINTFTLGAWLGAAMLLIALLHIRRRGVQIAAAVLLTAELFLAAQNQPYNDLAPPEVYLGQRFTISQLLAFQSEERVPGRTLSISQLYFDPGDIKYLRPRYDRLGMDAASQFHALDAVKKQEMLMPNLSLTWGIPSIDGFGGGITPSRQYALYSSLLLPEAAPNAVDGRLGERLAQPSCRGACIPDLRWLYATDTRYIITDKVYDVWHDDIAYDTTLARFWRQVDYIDPPDDITDQVRVLHSEPLTVELSATALPDDLWLTITDSVGLQEILKTDHSIIAVTTVNSRHAQIFQQIQPPPFERALSSDIKIFRLPTGERAWLAGTSKILPDDQQGYEDARQLLRQGESLVIHGEAEQRQVGIETVGTVDIIEYEATRVVLNVKSSAPAYLILRDAWYPGWQATVDGAPAPVYRANLIFRALPVPEGESVVSFSFEPRMWHIALYSGIALWIIAILMLLRIKRNNSRAPF